MTTDVITPAEAMEEVERRRIDIYPDVSGTWCATRARPQYQWAWGKSALEAVSKLLARIGEAAQKAEAANV